MLRSVDPVGVLQGTSLSSHPPFRLRLTLALLVLALVGTTVGAAVLFSTNQAAPTTIEVADIGLTGPPVVGGIDYNPAAAETAGSGMRLGVLDKDAARREQREAAAAREAEALRALADAAEAEAIAAYADAVAAAAANEEPDRPTPAGVPPPNDDGDGGGGGGAVGASLYEKLDNIATCESGRNPRAHNPEGPWWGAFQFHLETWQTYGGGGNRGRDILNHSYEQQRSIAANLARARGFAGSWPSCAARYGYT